MDALSIPRRIDAVNTNGAICFGAALYLWGKHLKRPVRLWVVDIQLARHNFIERPCRLKRPVAHKVLRRGRWTKLFKKSLIVIRHGNLG